MIKKLEDMLYPKSIYCIMCGSVIDGTRKYSLCDNCIEKFMWIKDRTCAKCGKILEGYWQNDLCGDCMEREHYFDKGFTCSKYGLYERNLILEFKKRDKSYIGRILGEILYDRIVIENIDFDVIISVPIHRARLRERGYNQAELMAKFLAERLGVKYVKDVLKRTRKTIPMKKLGVWDRMKNLEGAFAVNEGKVKAIESKNVLLVDDIYTTGATLDVCSKILKEKGAAKIYVITFAAGSMATR